MVRQPLERGLVEACQVVTLEDGVEQDREARRAEDHEQQPGQERWDATGGLS